MKNQLYKTSQDIATILGVRVDSTSTIKVLDKIIEKLRFSHENSKFYVVTPNPEIVLQAQTDEKLMDVINKADVSVPDGVGLKLFGDFTINIIPGRKLMLSLCRVATEHGYHLFLLGGSKKANRKAVINLQTRFPGLQIEGYEGPVYDSEANPVSEVDLARHFDTVERINKFKPHLIFVALGAPKQEKWIDKYLPVVNARGAMTVGGAVDYLSGEASLPPAWMENLKLEWLWRFVSQPWRVGRILNATLVFPVRVLLKRYKFA